MLYSRSGKDTVLSKVAVQFLELLIQSKPHPVQFVVIMPPLRAGKLRIFIAKKSMQSLFSSNLVHGSDSEKAAKREVDIWFKPEELLSYHRAGAQHLHDKYSGE